MGEDDFIPISALQHYLYCPRQCALIHLEQQWVENRLTAEGRVLHERADVPKTERRRGVRTVSAIPLADAVLGITGKADIVEFHEGDSDGSARVVPIEYKRGRPKAHRADEVQLCAQALCLESMLNRTVDLGALFYGQTRRRKEVIFDPDLRMLTVNTIRRTRAMFDSGRTPPASYEKTRCDACSLIDLCQPRLPSGREVAAWLVRELED